MTPSYFRIGGLMMDLPAGFDRRVKQFLADFPAALDMLETLVTGNTIWQSRTTAKNRLAYGLARHARA